MLGDITNQKGVVYATFPSMHSKKWAGYKQEIDRRKQADGKCWCSQKKMVTYSTTL